MSRRAPRTVATLSRAGPSTADPSARTRASTRRNEGSYPAVASSSSGRQLRSRLVPPAAAAAAAANATYVRGRRRSQSVSSSVALETSCTTERRAVAVQTRSGVGTARMSLGGWRTSRARTRAEPESLLSAEKSSSRTALKNVKRKVGRPKKIIEQELVSCSSADCSERFLPEKLAEHLGLCSSCFPCPLASHDLCQWQGLLNQGAEHVLKDHGQIINCRTGTTTIVALKNWKRAAPQHWITVQTCLGEIFLVFLQKVMRSRCPTFIGTVRVLGHQEDPDRYEFRMSLKSQGVFGRRFSYSSVVRGLHDESEINKGDHFVFDSTYAEIFKKDEGLQVEVSISVMKM